MTKRCFVIQGFGKKQDYAQGKLFNLDASYDVIKEGIEEAGLECYRADELPASGMIDQAMYEQLLSADLVVADITTLNFNAAYELGVRYALRPHATVVIAEQGINFPFDVGHVPIEKYQHLGEDIGNKEAKRLRGALKKIAQDKMASLAKDSPVYTFLPRLPEDVFLGVAEQAQAPTRAVGGGTSLRMVTDQAKAAMEDERFTDAVALWQQAKELAVKDDYIVQQLALATYKSKQPDPKTALREAKKLLDYLQPHGSFDTETLGLWAAVHKRLFEITKDMKDLEEALFALERGFFVKQDYYNGINLAFMLDIQAETSSADIKSELHALARYVRRRVKDICDKGIQGENLGNEDRYWLLATLYEACVGLGEEADALRWKVEASKLSVADWMPKATEDQIARLRTLLS